MTQLVMPFHCNSHGSLFGGQLVAWIDGAASTAAMRHCHTPVVTVSIDQMTFKKPVKEGHAVVLTARVDWVGRTSMEVSVDVYAEDLMTGERFMSNHAYLTFVAVDHEFHPLPVPELLLETAAEREAFAQGAKRRQRRLEVGS